MTSWRSPRLKRPRRKPPGRPLFARSSGWLALVALLAFGLRGLIPVGFEPADGSLAVVLCHEGFPADYFSHGKSSPQQHAGHGDKDSHCLFCSGGGSAPASALTATAFRACVAFDVVPCAESSLQSVRLAHIPQARAPPAFA